MRSAAAIRHVAFEDLGSFEPVLRALGYQAQYLDPVRGALSSPASVDPDLLVVLGGPIGAYEDTTYPFLRHELALIERRLREGRPMLGVCLGAQLIARALGAQVYGASEKELGWGPVGLTPEGQASCLAPLGAEGARVLHWHGDTFDLPVGARRLAYTNACENQAFAWGESVLALQFHLEVTRSGLEHWYVGHAHEIVHSSGTTVGALRADAERWAPLLEITGAACLRSWVGGLPASEAGRTGP